jgi:CRISPR system Cascade subunit CasC
MGNVFVDFHVIQTVPPSCVNRDDTGSPKSAVYGGTRRARVSSQSWKRAMRLMFRERFAEADLGIRTKQIVSLVAARICALAPAQSETDAIALAEKVINAAGVTTKNSAAKALFFMSAKQAENLAVLALRPELPIKKEIQAALNKDHGVDVALFGRMVADDPSLNTDASAQVAHSISTHQVENEYDYFTAVDDQAPEDNAGAGMLGTVEYNSSTLYRYGTVAAHDLFRQLAENPSALAKAVQEFARAFITSMPTGRQNTFANRTIPDAVLVTIRTDQPLNLAGAFEEAVKGKNGYAAASVKRLAAHAVQVYADYSCPPDRAFVIGGRELFAAAKSVTLAELLTELGQEMAERFPAGGLWS